MRRMFGFAGVFALVACAMAATTGAGPDSAGKPVIAKPLAAPEKPVAGKPFATSFRVTRSDTGARLLSGRMTGEPSIGGKAVPHVESFRGGTARVSLVVPADAANKLLKVKVTIRSAGGSASRTAAFRVVAPPVVPAVSIASASVPEGDQGTTVLSMPVTLSAPTTQTVSVQYASTDGTATAGSDYAAANGTLTFAPGETAKTISVTVNGDTVVEPDETVNVGLLNPVNATLAAASAVGTVRNDDVPRPLPGHYAGTTGQGYDVSFDVAADLSGLSNIHLTVDADCGSVGAVRFFGTWPQSIRISQTDWSYSDALALSVLTPGDARVYFRGSLTLDGKANGSVQGELGLPWGGSCQSGPVSYSVTKS